MCARVSKFLAVASMFAVPIAIQAATLKVPQQYASVQAAIDAAVDGDVIRVAAGTYHENLNIEAKTLSVIGAGADQTILDGGRHGRVMRIFNAPAPGVTLAGFTIRNGMAADQEGGEWFGGGLWAFGSKVTLRDNVFTANSACLGMAILVQGGAANLLHNRIVDNVQTNECGVDTVMLHAVEESFVEQNVIADNPAPALYVHTNAKVHVRRNVIRNNTESPEIGARGWGGLGSYVTQLVIENNLFENNNGSIAGALFLGDAENGPMVIRNNSFVGNQGPYASALMMSNAFFTGVDISSNLFSDDNGTVEVLCDRLPLGKNNVFASSTTPATDGC